MTSAAYIAPTGPGGTNGLQQSPLGNYTTPSYNVPPQQYQGGRGICTLSAPGVGTLQFRTNPNEITWDYSLITHVEETYGGRVVQILGVKMDNLVVKVDCGQGGWPYAMYVVQFMRDMMVTQRNGQAATFTYTTRGWQLKVFALNVPYFDAVEETVRELTLQFNVQEDVSGVQTSSAISDALLALQNGIGWVESMFNNFAAGPGTAPNNAAGGGPATALQSTLNAQLPTALTALPNMGIPGSGNISSLFGGLGGL